MKILVLEDEAEKYFEVRKALEYSGVNEIDQEADFKLIERFKKDGISIPVIICSRLNYSEPEAYGTVWCDDRRDINADFKELIDKLKEKVRRI